MADQGYEFKSLRVRDRLPLITAKLVCALLMAWTSYLCVTNDDLPSRMVDLSLILSLTFFYANLANIKYELKQLFEPPIYLIGYPMFVLANVIYFWSIYI